MRVSSGDDGGVLSSIGRKRDPGDEGRTRRGAVWPDGGEGDFRQGGESSEGQRCGGSPVISGDTWKGKIKDELFKLNMQTARHSAKLVK